MITIYIDKEIIIISWIHQLLSKIHYGLLKSDRPININDSEESTLHLRNRSRVFVSEAETEIHNSPQSRNI